MSGFGGAGAFSDGKYNITNDFGGTLTNESISRAAGASHGQELRAERMQDLIRSIGRVPRQRTTLYADVEPRSSGVEDIVNLTLSQR